MPPPAVVSTPSIALSRSPSGSEAFSFCHTAPSDPALPLVNVAWLAFIAANEYSHAMRLGPLLNRLGFYHVRTARDRMWDACTRELRELRAAERAMAPELRRALGTPRLRALALGLLPASSRCARAYVEGNDFDPRAFPAAGFERHLVRVVVPGSRLQFFSGGRLSSDGTAFVDGSTQVLFARHRRRPVVVISFRGTEVKRRADLIADLKAWRVPLARRGWPAAWGSVHAGFLDAFTEVEALLLAKLRELEGEPMQVWITGHSLGGALATLMAARLMRAQDEGLRVRFAGLITFGSPRVGNARFAETFAAERRRRGALAIRVRHRSDVVTHVPTAAMGYRHVGRLLHLDGERLAFAPSPEPPLGRPSAADHPMARYYDAVIRALYRPENRRFTGCAAGPPPSAPAGVR